jgi:hypothetical protein
MYAAADGIEAYVYEDKIEDADAGVEQLCDRGSQGLLWGLQHSVVVGVLPR